MVQDKVKELNLLLQRILGDYAYNTYEDRTCLDLVYKYDEKLGKEYLNIFYADTQWYKQNGYTIINIEDLIL